MRSVLSPGVRVHSYCDIEDAVVATLSPPKLQTEEEEEVESETELIGEDGEPIEGSAEGEDSGDEDSSGEE